MKRILLIEPPFYRLYESDFVLCNYPLSLGSLAGAIRQRTDWDVKVYNADFAVIDKPFAVSHAYLAGEGFKNYLRNLRSPSAPIWSEIEAVIRDVRPDVIGITSKSQNFISACNVAGLAKRLDPGITVILGGPHATLTGRDALRCPDIDLIVRGEGEETIAELLRALASGADIAGVRGVAFKRGREVVETPARPLIADLDALPFPHQGAEEALIGYADYPPSAFMNVFATRGCPFNCLYCGSRYLWTRHARFRSPENVVREMTLLKERGVARVHFDDDTFGTSKRHIHALCDAMIAAGAGVPWSCEIHVRLVDDAVVDKMRRAGCVMVFMGIESGSDEILRSIRKHTTVEQALRACRIIKAHGIRLNTFFMVGFPDETRQTMEQTFEVMRRADSDYLVYSIFTPYPGTEAFDVCRERGLIGDEYDVALYNHQSPENCFSSRLGHDEFRALASEIEAFVDAHNAAHASKPRPAARPAEG